MSEQSTPPKISPKILELAKEVSPMEKLQYIPLAPLSWCQELDCFGNVDEQVRKSGGSVQLGWQIWEFKNVLIEAEFHAVWKSPEGKLIDITPKPYAFKTILFIPDNTRQYTGRQIDNIRMPLKNDDEINLFIGMCKREFEIYNEGDRAGNYAFLPSDFTTEERDELSRIESMKKELINTLKEKYN